MSSVETEPKLFQQIRVGDLTLAHRIVLAPLTRFRASDAHVPVPIMEDYYSQRASVPGTLLITEATFIDARAGGTDNIPGIWSEEQVYAWKKIVDAVHAKGSYIFMQLWALGRMASPAILAQTSGPSNPGGPHPYVSASSVQLNGNEATPRPLTHDEILEYIELYRKAAKNAVFGAGFDGVEVHGAHGYLIDQFLQDVSNKRDDEWGGDIERRTRFALEVVKAIVDAVGEERTAIRLSPWNLYGDMRMSDPIPTFAHLVSTLRDLYPRFAYIHVVEPRVSGIEDRTPAVGETNELLRKIWNTSESEQNGSAYMSAGGYRDREGAIRTVEEKGGLVAFGRYYIPNPDLPARIKNNLPLEPYDRSTFYSSKIPEGYSDYSFADPETEANYKRKETK